MKGLYQNFSAGTRGKIIGADTSMVRDFFQPFGFMSFAFLFASPLLPGFTLVEVFLISFPHFQHLKGTTPAFRKRAGVAKFWVPQYAQG